MDAIEAKANEIRRLHKVCREKDKAMKAAIYTLETCSIVLKGPNPRPYVSSKIDSVIADLNDCLG